MDNDAFLAKQEEGKEIPDQRGEWWQMIYNEQHAPAAQWFSERGWTAAETTLSDYLVSNGRAVPTEADESKMVDSVRLVRAVKN